MRFQRSVFAVLLGLCFALPAWGVAAAPPDGMPDDAELAVVREVVDGDTLRVTLDNGTKTTVRLIGIDTPETKDPDEPVGCYGPEASARLEQLLEPGREIWLESDVSDKDRYDRLLRYVWVEKNDGDVYLLNEVLMRDGFAVTLEYPPDTARAEQLERAQAGAQAAGKGLWSACPELAASLLPAPEPTPVPTAVPATVPTEVPVAAAPNCDSSYPTICVPSYPDLNCPEIPYANFQVIGSDPHGFDRDNDGIGCES